MTHPHTQFEQIISLYMTLNKWQVLADNTHVLLDFTMVFFANILI